MILCVHKGVPNEKNHYKKTSNYAALRRLLNKQIQSNNSGAQYVTAPALCGLSRLLVVRF
ncbi:hypothetical protein AWI62_10650 [Salmonella enterica]|uniref:Uncharacterized protein n=1 Tax=Salmonella diarizonae TaxID=59204 RepID=A0A635JAZ6_SALDZ|nr:hypothetical protein [Salmonella enterica]ECE0888864.1 hypothetical protein [Salmonella enterica subsp. diarizonae]ECG1311239.1 hypothetical protein [Salmonella enterica subsp. diarizonae]ECI5276290.1 hypothetical protein [Salmonella enterica subsp. diarizonae]EDH7457397.1 hypothetical protein [Salmonella enterica subsp. diarizonae]